MHSLKTLATKALILFVAILFSGSLQAQKVHISWGEPVKRKGYFGKPVIVVGSDNTLYTTFQTRKKRFIEKYDEKSRLVFSKELNMEGPDGKEVEFREMMMLDGKILMFSTYYDKRADEHRAFLSHIDANGNNVSGFKMIDKIDATKRSNKGNFSFLLSGDSTHILVFHSEPYDKKGAEKFNLSLIDKDMNVKWQKDIELPYADKSISLESFLISSDNKIYLLARHMEKIKRRKYDIDYLLYSFNEKGGLEEQTLELNDKFITDVKFSLDKEGNIVCAGFYSEESLGGAGGVFYMVIDPDNRKNYKVDTKKFDFETKEELQGKRTAKKDFDLFHYKMREVIPGVDGGIIMVAEYYHHYVHTTTTRNSNGTTTTTQTHYYHYNDILVTSVDKKGKINWIKNIPKFQTSTNDDGYYSSYSLIAKGDKLYFTYNDNAKNVDVYERKKLKGMNMRKGMLMLAVMDKNTGDYKKTTIVNYKDKEARYYVIPKAAQNYKNNQLVMYSTGKKETRYGRLSVQ